MNPGECTQCATEFEGPGIVHRGRFFCSDDCCEKWEDEFARNGEPEPDELDDNEVPQEDLDFSEDNFDDDYFEDDDDSEISIDDF